MRVTGVVQGVGFRPFVHRLARDHELAGHVCNDGEAVITEVEGTPSALERFAAALAAQAPPLARVTTVEVARLAPIGARGFEIRASTGVASAGATPLPPDVATCSECVRELFDPTDRRYRHPFITCTHCGPRFTIVTGLPYDRARTTMAGFAMCERCRSEYEDPADRRHHAETICCPDCGPALRMPLEEAVAILRDGGILAVKGLGGYHLACDATSEPAVARLRERKRREAKPLAVMTSEPELLVRLGPAERVLLHSPARPIVIVRRRAGAQLAASVAPGSRWLGVMLPYSPLHHLLLADFGGPLVMTSGNLTDEPICVEDADARARLGAVADAFLDHDRPIHRRCEDSVVRAGFPIRRSRGHAPDWLALPRPADRALIATGAELKATFCVAQGSRAWLSAHLGDLDAPAARSAFAADVELALAALALTPELVACDLHPDYASTRWALEQDAELVRVQHHHAHAAACLAEHGEQGEALALIFDGTGLGTDGTLWGGELLRCDLERFERVAHLEAVPLPGGEAAIHEPWRIASAYLERAGRPVPFERWPLVRQSLRTGAPLSSGMGRLFDAVAALVCGCEHAAYEGQAAVLLEELAGSTRAAPYPCRIAGELIYGSDLVAAAHDDLLAGRRPAEIAAAFHEGVAAAAIVACEAAGGPRTVVLSGGSFQNVRLLRSVAGGLRSRGFRVLSHRRVPPNDGGISYGQAAVAAAGGGV
ncbi:MAG: carbamoyltransferase HypF [Solirubrobacteraceae bacterium]